MINIKQYLYKRSSIIRLKKRTFCNTSKNEMDKGKGKAVDNTDLQFGVNNTSDNSSQESITSSVFDIPDQLRANNIPINRTRRTGAPSNQPLLGDDDVSSTHSMTNSEYMVHHNIPTRNFMTRVLMQGQDIHSRPKADPLRRSSHEELTTGDLDMGEPTPIRALSVGYRTANIRELTELQLQAERALHLSTRGSHKTLREGEFYARMLDPNFREIDLSSSDSESEKSEKSKAISFSKGGSGGGPGNSGGGSSGTGSDGGHTGSGTVFFFLENLYELTIIFPCLIGITSTILAINPETLMYFRLIITLLREPTFKLYLYFKYVDLLCLIQNIKNILCLVLYFYKYYNITYTYRMLFFVLFKIYKIYFLILRRVTLLAQHHKC